MKKAFIFVLSIVCVIMAACNLDHPVDLPDDIKEFIDKIESDAMSKDLDRLMENYSENWNHNGKNKQQFRKEVKYFVQITESYRIIIKEFDNRGNRVYVKGNLLVNGFEMPYQESYIKENGQWKCYGHLDPE